MEKAALGFRVKSGWAMAVLISESGSPPRIIDRCRIELADPRVPDSAQPFHAGLDLPKAEGARVVARLVKVVETYAKGSVADLLKVCKTRGYRIAGAGIVAGSIVDPKTIGNDHIRAHAEEGRLFRVVIQGALKDARVKTSVTAEKELIAKGAKALRLPEPKLKAYLVEMGKAVTGSWRAEEKAAALAGWLALSQ